MLYKYGEREEEIRDEMDDKVEREKAWFAENLRLNEKIWSEDSVWNS